VNKMIRISDEELWNLIYHDVKIANELELLLFDNQRKRNYCYQKYCTEKLKLEKLQLKKEKLCDIIQILKDQIYKIHFKISSYEIKKIFLERQIKHLERLLNNPELPLEKKEKIQHDLEKTWSKMERISAKQLDCRKKISSFQSERKQKKNELTEQKKKIKEQERIISLELRNTVEWDITLEQQRTDFYQKSYENIHQNHSFLQEMVIRERERTRQETKEEAKEKTKEILIGDEEISLDPPGYVRRLTKEEREKYKSIN